MSSELYTEELNFIPTSSKANPGGINGLDSVYAYPTGSLGSGLVGETGINLYTPRIFSFRKSITIAGKLSGGTQDTYVANGSGNFFSLSINEFIDTFGISDSAQIVSAYSHSVIKIYGAFTIDKTIYKPFTIETQILLLNSNAIIQSVSFNYSGSDEDIVEDSSASGISVITPNRMVSVQDFDGGGMGIVGILPLSQTNPDGGDLTLRLLCQSSPQTSLSGNPFTSETGIFKGFIEFI